MFESWIKLYGNHSVLFLVQRILIICGNCTYITHRLKKQWSVSLINGTLTLVKSLPLVGKYYSNKLTLDIIKIPTTVAKNQNAGRVNEMMVWRRLECPD